MYCSSICVSYLEKTVPFFLYKTLQTRAFVNFRAGFFYVFGLLFNVHFADPVLYFVLIKRGPWFFQCFSLFIEASIWQSLAAFSFTFWFLSILFDTFPVSTSFLSISLDTFPVSTSLLSILFDTFLVSTSFLMLCPTPPSLFYGF